MNSNTLNEKPRDIKIVKVDGYYVQLEKVYEDQSNGMAGLLFIGTLFFIGIGSVIWHFL